MPFVPIEDVSTTVRRIPNPDRRGEVSHHHARTGRKAARGRRGGGSPAMLSRFLCQRGFSY